MKSTQIDDLNLAFVCRRERARTTNRTFKASCGSYLRFNVSAAGTVRSLIFDRRDCNEGCERCKEMETSARKVLTGTN